MSFSAMIPVAQMASANTALEAAGFGPRNFAVPAYTGPNPTYGVFHAWDDPAFRAAVEAIPNVVIVDDQADPQASVNAVVNTVSGDWGGDAKPLTGTVTPGLYKDANGAMWWVIQTYNTATWPDPAVIPALIRRARTPSEIAPWVQPIDQFDAYKLVNAFTGQPDRVTFNGQTWRVSQADGSGNNVWQPGVFGWVIV